MPPRKTTLAVGAAVTAAALAASGAPAIGTPHVRAALIKTPHFAITVTKTGHGSSATYNMVVKGPKRVSAGRVDLSLRGVHGEAAVDIVRIKKGHTFKEAVADFNKFGSSFGPTGPSAAGLRALRKVVKIVVFYGGLDTGSIRREHGSVVLPRAGHYLITNDSGQGPNGQARKLTVTARVGSRATPHVDAHVRAITAKRFRGSTTLPAAGTVSFKNDSTQSPHFLILQHVKAGTTRKQVIKALNSSSGPGPFRPENAGTDVVGMGHAVTLSYKLPAGTYAEMCFFPDLQTGMPHALMGMVRIVHLK
jgi:hypothetical protein